MRSLLLSLIALLGCTAAYASEVAPADQYIRMATKQQKQLAALRQARMEEIQAMQEERKARDEAFRAQAEEMGIVPLDEQARYMADFKTRQAQQLTEHAQNVNQLMKKHKRQLSRYYDENTPGLEETV